MKALQGLATLLEALPQEVLTELLPPHVLLAWARGCLLALPHPPSELLHEAGAARKATSEFGVDAALATVVGAASACSFLSPADWGLAWMSVPMLARRIAHTDTWRHVAAPGSLQLVLKAAGDALPVVNICSSAEVGSLPPHIVGRVLPGLAACVAEVLRPGTMPIRAAGQSASRHTDSAPPAHAGAGASEPPQPGSNWLRDWWAGAPAPSPTAASTASAAGKQGDAVQASEWPWWLWLLGNALDFVHFVTVKGLVSAGGPQALEVLLRYIARCVPLLPSSFWTSALPVLWKQSGSLQHAEAMPVLLVRQLRGLSDAGFLRGCALAALPDPSQHLTVPRLRLRDSEGATSSVPLPAPVQRGAASWWSRLWGARSAEDASASAGAPSGSSEAGSFTSWLQGSSLAKWLRKRPSAGSSSGQAEHTTARDAADAVAGVDGEIDQPWPSGLALAFGSAFGALLARAAGSSRAGMYSSEVFSDHTLISVRRLLNGLAFSPDTHIVRRLWYAAVQAAAGPAGTDATALEQRAIPTSGFAGSVALVGVVEPLSSEAALVYLALLAPLVRHLLIVVDDFELYQRSIPLPLRELQHLISASKAWLAKAYGYGVGTFTGAAGSLLAAPPTVMWRGVETSLVGMLSLLFDRHSRRALGPADMFTLPLEAGSSAWGGLPNAQIAQRLVHLLPCAVPFPTRLHWFHEVRLAEHEKARAAPAYRLRVNRATIFDSSFAVLGRSDLDLRRRLYVEFLNEHGLYEAGIDAGGLFKELWTTLAQLVFNPSYGLFRVTPDSRLYPNPQAAMAVGVEDDAPLFRFVGRILGKAAFEGVVVQPQFAPFTLAKLLGKPVNLHHLPSLDAELYKNLMFLKTYEGDARDLCLTFTLPGDGGDMSHGGGAAARAAAEVPLVPGGADKEVTNSNKVAYIHMVADAKLNKAMAKQTEAFVAGFRDVIPVAWTSAFAEPELQVLLSGAAGELDVDDLQAHTQYAGGYFSSSAPVRHFWSVMRELSGPEKAKVLRFATACERPPPLGFKDLEPRFTIQRVADTARLPSASTCFNILKLPAFSSKAVLKEKLLYSINSGAGFELS